MKTRRVELLILCVLTLAGVEARKVSNLLAFYPGQQGPPNAPPPTSPPSEPIILHSAPHRLPPDFQGASQQTPPQKLFDAARARRDAQQLAALASKIPSQVEQVSKGVLAKDLDRQLKDIQKLAKRLRGEVSP